MATTHGIVSLRLQKLSLAYLRTLNGGGTYKSVVMVYTSTLKFSLLPVKSEAVLRIEFYSADAKWNYHLISLLITIHHPDACPIAVWVNI